MRTDLWRQPCRLQSQARDTRATTGARVGTQACRLCAQRVSNPLSLMQQRESLLGAQTGKSVFRLIHLVKINLGPAMARTVASKIETVRTGNLRLPKYEPIAPPTIAATERINANAGMDCLALTKPAIPAIEFTRINNAETAEASFVFAQLEKSKRGVRKFLLRRRSDRRGTRCLNPPRARQERVGGDRRRIAATIKQSGCGQRQHESDNDFQNLSW